MQNDKNRGGQVGWQTFDETGNRLYAADRCADDDDVMPEHADRSGPVCSRWCCGGLTIFHLSNIYILNVSFAPFVDRSDLLADPSEDLHAHYAGQFQIQQCEGTDFLLQGNAELKKQKGGDSSMIFEEPPRCSHNPPLQKIAETSKTGVVGMSHDDVIENFDL
jgi:hypothetical protein